MWEKIYSQFHNLASKKSTQGTLVLCDKQERDWLKSNTHSTRIFQDTKKNYIVRIQGLWVLLHIIKPIYMWGTGIHLRILMAAIKMSDYLCIRVGMASFLFLLLFKTNLWTLSFPLFLLFLFLNIGIKHLRSKLKRHLWTNKILWEFTLIIKQKERRASSP